MDIFALPSAFEGFGIVFVEAAACGLLCIGTAVGGIVDAIDDEVTGVLVPPQNPEALAAAIWRLATDAPLRQRMGQAAAWRAERLHSVHGYAQAFESVFQQALARRGLRADVY
jgi:glycosyltransferase involved in cell wall biosynthesis